MHRIALVLSTMLSILRHFPAQISAHDLAEKMLVRFEPAKLLPGWHVGTVGLTKDGCVMIRKSAPELTHGRIGFSPTCIQKLERQDGENGWRLRSHRLHTANRNNAKSLRGKHGVGSSLDTAPCTRGCPPRYAAALVLVMIKLWLFWPMLTTSSTGSLQHTRKARYVHTD